MPNRKKNIDLDKLDAKTFYDELAEYGMLDEFVDYYLKDRPKDNTSVQDSINLALFKSSSKFEPIIEEMLLRKLSDVLSYFLDNVHKWKQTPQ